MSSPSTGYVDEAAARRVLLLQAFESNAGDDNPQWTFDDRAWATRLARDSQPAGSPPASCLAERARHAMQRLAPREAGVRRVLAAGGWHWWWWLLALLGGLALGLASGLVVDAIGSGQRINLLAPPVWVLIAWNLLVYLAMVMAPVMALVLPQTWTFSWPLSLSLSLSLRRHAGGGQISSATPMARFQALWLQHGAPLLRSRAAILLHTAAAAVALGLMAGLYLRGLVLDYRAGWQSTFLTVEQVQAALTLLLAPAVAFTGIAVPDAATLQALRVGADGAAVSTPPNIAALNSAAPWIHLYAAMLLLFVVLPRSVLVSMAALHAITRSRRLPLPLDGAYAQRLLREIKQQAARVQVLPHGAAPTPHLQACLQAVLSPVLGPGLQMTLATATAYGDEEQAAALRPGLDTTLRIALMDLTATPEADTHSAFVRALRDGGAGLPVPAPLLVLCDESAFRLRFAAMPERLPQRRAAWQRWAAQTQVSLVCIDLAQPDLAAAERALQAALNAP